MKGLAPVTTVHLIYNFLKVPRDSVQLTETTKFSLKRTLLGGHLIPLHVICEGYGLEDQVWRVGRVLKILVKISCDKVG